MANYWCGKATPPHIKTLRQHRRVHGLCLDGISACPLSRHTSKLLSVKNRFCLRIVSFDEKYDCVACTVEPGGIVLKQNVPVF